MAQNHINHILQNPRFMPRSCIPCGWWTVLKRTLHYGNQEPNVSLRKLITHVLHTPCITASNFQGFDFGGVDLSSGASPFFSFGSTVSKDTTPVTTSNDTKPHTDPIALSVEALLKKLRTAEPVAHNEEQDADIIISCAPDLHHGSGDGHGMALCQGLSRVVRDGGFTPFHVYMVPPGTARERAWLEESMSATVAVVLLSRAYFQSDVCVLELTKLCMSPTLRDRIVPLIVDPVDLSGDFLVRRRQALDGFGVMS